MISGNSSYDRRNDMFIHRLFWIAVTIANNAVAGKWNLKRFETLHDALHRRLQRAVEV